MTNRGKSTVHEYDGDMILRVKKKIYIYKERMNKGCRKRTRM